ncbi:MAG: metal ABC transporter solute-binding protein, Zn/Mn family [Syntrophales bacterium]
MACMVRNLILIALGVVLFSGTGLAGDRIPIFVSIVPQKYFVQQIGRDLVDVQFMVQPGASPATYEPKPRQMADLAGTKVYFAIGVPFEKVWLNRISAANPGMRVVRTDQGIGKLGLDPHIWLSPPLVKVQARAILAALQEIDPVHRSVYQANFQEFVARIDRLDGDLKRIFAGRQGLRFMVFHPAWGYFAHAYGLKQVPIEFEGKDPKPSQLKRLIEQARRDGIRVVFVQPQFSTKSAGLVAREIGGQVAFADPLAEDWMGNLREVADKFQAALK